MRDLSFFFAVALGLGVSMLLFLDAQAHGHLCSASGGCEAVQQSALARPFGVPLSLFGIFHFASVLGLALAMRGIPISRGLRWVGGTVGALTAAAGLFFLAAQAFWIHSFCPYCVVVDGAAIWVGLSGPWMGRAPVPVHRVRPLRTGAVVLALALLPAVLVFGVEHEHAPSGEIAAVDTAVLSVPELSEGQLAVVEFVDFACAYCRRLHGALKTVLPAYGDRVRLVRRHFPLPAHPGAEIAARAACCGETMGAGEALADALFAAQGLSEATCVAAAEGAGLDAAAFRECLASPMTAARVQRDIEAGHAVGIRGLPTLFIDGHRHEGAASVEELRTMIDSALAGGQG